MSRISDGELRSLRSSVRLSELISKSVKLEKRGPDWFGLCPFHEEKTASFSVNDEKRLFYCFGCQAGGDVFDWLQRTEGLDFPSSVARAKAFSGAEDFRAGPSNSTCTEVAKDKITQIAQQIWKESTSIRDTAAEFYLREVRRIGVSLPASLRFHSSLKPGVGNLQSWPAMVAGVADINGCIVAIQRTFLAEGGHAKAPIKQPKMQLGKRGAGAVRLGLPGSIIGIAEGIETGLSAMELFCIPVWCGLGATLDKVWLPNSVSQVVIFADRGDAGASAADRAMRRYRGVGLKVAVQFPSAGFGDFNDELQALRK